jgi:4-aminobutyrate aminotransferase-like enzyme
VLAAALERHLPLLSCGTRGQAVRVIPPLVTTDDEIDQAIAVIRESIASLS